MTRFVRAPNVLSRRVGREVLLARASRGEVDRLSDSAGAVWNLLEESESVRAIVATLSAAYGVSPGQIEPDVRVLLDDLVDRGWVEQVASDD